MSSCHSCHLFMKPKTSSSLLIFSTLHKSFSLTPSLYNLLHFHYGFSLIDNLYFKNASEREMSLLYYSDLPNARRQLCTKIRNIILAFPDLQDRLIIPAIPNIPPFKLHHLLGQRYSFIFLLVSNAN